MWISPTVQHSNKTGNSYSTSLFVDNDLTYPKVSITRHGLGFICHACFHFFFEGMGWGGGGVGRGLVERKVIIRRDYRGQLLEEVLLRKKRFCKYHIAENVCNKEKRLKTKVRRYGSKAILHMSRTCKM